MMMDLSTFQWHAPFLPLFDMPLDALPRIVSNAEVYGHVAEGPLTGVPISGCLGDQMAAVLGEEGHTGRPQTVTQGGLPETGGGLISSILVLVFRHRASLRYGGGEEHVRDRMLHAAQHRPQADALHPRPADHAELQAGARRSCSVCTRR